MCWATTVRWNRVWSLTLGGKGLHLGRKVCEDTGHTSQISVLELLLGQGAEWKIKTENQRKEWKILTYFIHPSFSIRHNRLNVGHK